MLDRDWLTTLLPSVVNHANCKLRCLKWRHCETQFSPLTDRGFKGNVLCGAALTLLSVSVLRASIVTSRSSCTVVKKLRKSIFCVAVLIPKQSSILNGYKATLNLRLRSENGIL